MEHLLPRGLVALAVVAVVVVLAVLFVRNDEDIVAARLRWLRLRRKMAARIRVGGANL